jgi:biopolymer transport protein ExbB
MLWEWIVAGGMTMVMLILCSTISIGVVLERTSFFRRIRAATFTLEGQITEALATKKPELIPDLCAKNESPLAKLVIAEIESNKAPDSEEARRTLELTMRGEIGRLKSYLPVLATIASVAPFIGLFGTCKGIIVAFSDIATQGMGGPAVIAAGISEALVSTATGLLVAIPALLFFNFFSRSISTFALELESQAFETYRHYTSALGAAAAKVVGKAKVN